MRFTWKDKIKEIAFTFAWITTFIVLANAIMTTIYYDPGDTVSVFSLWGILGVAFLTSLGNLLYWNRDMSTKSYLIRKVIHYIYILSIVMGCGGYLGWVHWDDLFEALMIATLVTLIFFAVFALNIVRDKQQAQVINKQLEQFDKEE